MRTYRFFVVSIIGVEKGERGKSKVKGEISYRDT